MAKAKPRGAAPVKKAARKKRDVVWTYQGSTSRGSAKQKTPPSKTRGVITRQKDPFGSQKPLLTPSDMEPGFSLRVPQTPTSPGTSDKPFVKPKKKTAPMPNTYNQTKFWNGQT